MHFFAYGAAAFFWRDAENSSCQLNGSTNGSGATRALPLIVQPKLNSGKEPFKCGMESAECGVRPSLISVIAQLRAPSRRDPLPLWHSE